VRRLASHIFTAAAAPLAFFALLSVPAAAHAQSPFNCKTPPSIGHTGPVDSNPKNGSISGKVVIICDGTSIYADKITWDETTVVATGDVLVIQEGLRVNALRMEMDRVTKMGTFFQAVGTANLTGADAEGSMFGTMEPEVMFQAEKLERIGSKSYRITNGRFSTCQQPNPRWQMTGSSGTIVMDDHAIMKNVALRVKGVPVMYLPYMYLPLEKEDRATGFLIPQYTASGVQGWGLSNAFFLVLGRSHDATFYYDWRSKGYQGAGTEYRYKASEGSYGEA
jgi:LPS-assembly protein